jgi:hypothetical protein
MVSLFNTKNIMEYTILNTEYTEDTIYTTVEYNIEGHIVEVRIAHFQPKDFSVMDGILNRYMTEMYKIFPERMPPIPVFIEPAPEPFIEEEQNSILDDAINGVNSFVGE